LPALYTAVSSCMATIAEIEVAVIQETLLTRFMVSRVVLASTSGAPRVKPSALSTQTSKHTSAIIRVHLRTLSLRE